MAGLGRGLSALLSDSAKANQKRGTGDSDSINDLLSRSIASSKQGVIDDATALSPKDAQETVSANKKESKAKAKAKTSSSKLSEKDLNQNSKKGSSKSVIDTHEEEHITHSNASSSHSNHELDMDDVNNYVGKEDLSSALDDSQEEFESISLLDETPLKDIKYSSTKVDSNIIHYISLANLHPSSYQPRQDFDETSLKELSDSISKYGIIEPLIVKHNDGDRYEIICGERRFRAAKQLGLVEVPCLVRELETDSAYAIALIENIQRENLNPIEQAIAFEHMMKSCGMSQAVLAKNLGKPRSSLANILRMLNLCDAAKDAVRKNKIGVSMAKVLLSIEDSKDQAEVCEAMIEQNMSVKEAEKFAKELLAKRDAERKLAAALAFKNKEDLELQKAAKEADEKRLALLKSRMIERLTSYESNLNQTLNGVKAKFFISKSDQNKGKLTLSYDNPDELLALLTALGQVQNENELSEDANFDKSLHPTQRLKSNSLDYTNDLNDMVELSELVTSDYDNESSTVNKLTVNQNSVSDKVDNDSFDHDSDEEKPSKVVAKKNVTKASASKAYEERSSSNKSSVSKTSAVKSSAKKALSSSAHSAIDISSKALEDDKQKDNEPASSKNASCSIAKRSTKNSGRANKASSEGSAKKTKSVKTQSVSEKSSLSKKAAISSKSKVSKDSEKVLVSKSTTKRNKSSSKEKDSSPAHEVKKSSAKNGSTGSRTKRKTKAAE